MIVQVTKEHIARGANANGIHNSLHNPIAIAIQEMEGTNFAVVPPTRVHRTCEHEGPIRPDSVPHVLYTKAFCGVYELPYQIQQWLVEYNAGRYAPPIQFSV